MSQIERYLVGTSRSAKKLRARVQLSTCVAEPRMQPAQSHESYRLSISISRRLCLPRSTPSDVRPTSTTRSCRTIRILLILQHRIAVIRVFQRAALTLCVHGCDPDIDDAAWWSIQWSEQSFAGRGLGTLKTDDVNRTSKSTNSPPTSGSVPARVISSEARVSVAKSPRRCLTPIGRLEVARPKRLSTAEERVAKAQGGGAR